MRFVLFAIALCSYAAASAQSDIRSGFELVANLLGRETKGPDINVGIGGPRDAEFRAWSASLVKLGPSALPAIDDALDSWEKDDNKPICPLGGDLLLQAYVLITGPAALPRLRIMLANPHLSPLRQSLDDAAARALHLTSYVSAAGSFEALGMKTLCCSTEPLKSTLDQLITSWQANSAAEMEKPLGRNARFAIRQATDLPKSPNDPEAAIGYRFVTPGSWSQPDLVKGIDPSPPKPVTDPTLAAQIDTVFTNRFGRECGQVRVQFLLNSVEGGGDSPVAYRVEHSNVLDLLRTFAACAQSQDR